jgi:hypothetical protein
MMIKRLIGLLAFLITGAALAAGPNTTTPPLNLLNSEGAGAANYLVCSSGTVGNPPAWCTIGSRLVAGTNVTLSGTTAVTINASGVTPGGSANDIQYNSAGTALGGITLTNGQLIVGATSSTPLAKTMSGDCTLAASGAITCTGLSGAYFAISGPASSAKTFTFPNASATVLTTNAAVTVAQGGTGAATLSTGKPLFGAGTSAITTGTLSGSTTVLATSTGSLVSGDCVSIDASGNYIDAGGPCTTGGGGGTVTSALINQMAWYSSAGTTVVGLATANSGALITSSGGVPSIGKLPLANMATIAANTVLANNTASSSIPIAIALPSCSTSTSALIYTTSTNLGCNVFGTVVTQNTGTSGGNVPLLNGNNTYSGSANFTGTFQIGTQTMAFPASADTLAGLGTVETFTAAQTFTNGKLLLKGSSSGAGTLEAPAAASTYVWTFPAATGNVLTDATAITVAQGGTGLATLTANNVILGNGTSTPGFVAPSTSGNVLTSNGTTWTSAAPASAVQRWTLINSTSVTASMAPFSIAVSNEDILIVVSDVIFGPGGACEIAFSTNSGSSYSNYTVLNSGGGGAGSYGNILLTGLHLGSVNSLVEISGNPDTTNPAINSSNFANSFSFNPGAAITNIKIGSTAAFAGGGTINTYGRN